MENRSGDVPKIKAKKHLKQPSIVTFLDDESQRKFVQKHFSTPVKNDPNLTLRGDMTPLSPIEIINTENVIYPSPLVDLNAVNKDKTFYSLSEFTDDMKTTEFKKALFKIQEKCQAITAEEKFDALKREENKKEFKQDKNKKKPSVHYPWLNEEGSDSDKVSSDASSCKSGFNFESDEGHSDLDNIDPENLRTNMDKLEVTKLLAQKAQQKSLRTPRLPNEIQTVSQVCPVLFRDPPKQSLRYELDNLGISEPFSIELYTFSRCLEDFGLELVNDYFDNKKPKSLKTCFYCGFQTESTLVLGRHLDDKHRNKFKVWPFSSRMDSIKYKK